MNGEPATKTGHPNRAPTLFDAYHKARRSYGLVSGLLLAWEPVGIELACALITNFKATLKSPHAAPYILIALVGYSRFDCPSSGFDATNGGARARFLYGTSA